jgi:hypothetical protein
MGKCPTKGFVVKLSYMVHVAPESRGVPRNTTPECSI